MEALVSGRGNRLQAKEIKEKLITLINEASLIDPSLARRLDEINRWVKDIKSGSLTAKRFVILFLEQIIRDAQIWLDIQALDSEEEQRSYYERMTPAEQYWYSELFPKWLSENDPKFYIWRQKLMTGEFGQQDADIMKSIANNIAGRGGNAVQRYIADLSMATDIIISSRQEKPLCIQLTRVSDEFSQEKSQDWETTLLNWGIERGLFLSYNPAKADCVNQIGNMALYNSDNLRAGIYLKFSL